MESVSDVEDEESIIIDSHKKSASSSPIKSMENIDGTGKEKYTPKMPYEDIRKLNNAV